jgi:hypothetical protein
MSRHKASILEMSNKFILLVVIFSILCGILTVNTTFILIGSFFSFFYSIFSIEMIQKLVFNVYIFLTGKEIKNKKFLSFVCVLLTLISFLISVRLEKIPAPFLFLKTENFGNVLMSISIIISYLDTIFFNETY